MASREEWLAWRRTGITATDAAALVGLSRWSSPYSVWANKAGLLPEDEASDAMEFGTRAEPMLSQWFHDRTGMWVRGEQSWCANPAEPWMLATVDGFAVEDGNDGVGPRRRELGGVEHKTTSDSPGEWDTAIPDDIMCQVQWQMAVTGMPRTWLSTLHLGFRVRYVVRVIERDEDDIAALIAAARPFWLDHCLTGIAPPACGLDATTMALGSVWTGDTKLDAVEADADLAAARALILVIKEQIKYKEDGVTAAENQIKAALGDHTALTAGTDAKGRPIVLATWNPSETTRLDVKRITAELPDVCAPYMTTKQTRTLLIKQFKET